MVESSEEYNFKQNWSCSGEATYDPHTKKWSVDGNVYLRRAPLGGVIPHEFDVVRGWMDISGNNLTTLKGCPRKCLLMEANDNALTSLEHVPECERLHVHVNPLRDLSHMPMVKELRISWNPHLPMLRCLMAQKVLLTIGPYTPLLQKIFNDTRWAGMGKAGVLNCALELKKQGDNVAKELGITNPFINNAKW